MDEMLNYIIIQNTIITQNIPGNSTKTIVSQLCDNCFDGMTVNLWLAYCCNFNVQFTHTCSFVVVFQASEEAAQLVKHFYALQEERVHTYQLFDQYDKY